MYLAFQICLKTWDNLIKDWFGPSYCILCKQAIESTDHLLTGCEFTLHIWKNICFLLNITQVWEEENFDICLLHWLNSSKNYHSLPAIISWKIWSVGNVCLFEDHLQSSNIVCNHIIQLNEEFNTKPVTNSKPRYLKDIQLNGAIGDFDGKTKDGLCAARVVLMINNIHAFKFKLHCGTCTNMKEELLAL